ncbi:phospholipase A and acyltransferase 4-like [Perca fluviatilis]|uniref:phospholipase A and acyltransferase 4-like n=1 Tax=Perca fluviatilis TaxID=8168 RepID=UPI001962A75E|nr:phospholipase A and acyltransferase 4-like [Perca fluviatilis]
MAPTRFNAKPGDLIEISRGIYQHWAFYIGGEEVVHLTTPNGDSNSSGSSLMVLDSPIGKVKRENIRDVVCYDEFKINNLLDDQPRESYIIVKEACSMVGLELPYSIMKRNCEHFVTDLRYDKSESRQVTTAAEIGGATVGILVLGGLGALVASWLKDYNKEERREERREPRREPRRHYNWQQ